MFDPPPQGKMLWCSYFKSFIKSTNFSSCGNVIKKLNLVSTPWKIIIPLGNSVGDHIWVKKSIWVGNDFFTPKCQFLRIWCKNLIVAGVLRKNIWFSVSIPEIKFEPPPQGKNALVFIF